MVDKKNQRPPLLPTPIASRYNRNASMNSDTSRNIRTDDVESVDMDMEMSDDEPGMDSRSVGSIGGEYFVSLNLIVDSLKSTIISRPHGLLSFATAWQSFSSSASNKHEQTASSINGSSDTKTVAAAQQQHQQHQQQHQQQQ